jgi:hypothetical protein
MFTFLFSKEELFAALSQFQGKKRQSIVGMYKSCNTVDTALAIAYFLKKNNLGGYKVSASSISLKCEIYLNPQPIKLPKVKKTSILLYI